MAENPAPELDPCGWCGAPAVTEVVTVPGRAKKRYAPVCEDHATHFEGQGQLTRRREHEALSERERRRADYLKQAMPWLNKKEND